MEEIKGFYDVEFISGIKRSINVIANILDAVGHPIYLKCESGRVYNWTNILSIKKRS